MSIDSKKRRENKRAKKIRMNNKKRSLLTKINLTEAEKKALMELSQAYNMMIIAVRRV
jgi:hypothetical protein